jgi:hypothetical protein
MSSGGHLALEAAAHRLAITTLAVYEPPFVDDSLRQASADYATQLNEANSSSPRDDAVGCFLTQVGAPGDVAAQARLAPICPVLEDIACTFV